MRKMLLALAALQLITSCTEKKEAGNLHITGNIKGLKMGTVYIEKLEDTSMVVLDSITINGKPNFSSNLNIDSPEMLYLVLDRGQTKNMDNNLMFFAEPGTITIDANLDKFYADAKITGSKNNDLYDEFKKIKSRFTGQELDLMQKKLDPKRDRQQFSDEEYQRQSDAIVKRKYLYAINFAINHKAYEIAPFVALSEVNDANPKYLEMIYKALTPKVAGSKYGKMLKTYLEKLNEQK